MANLTKRPIVIQDLIAHATYISLDNFDAGDRFLYAAEETFQRIAELPGIGRLSRFSHPTLAKVRQYLIRGFSKHIIFYQIHPETVEIIRVLHGAQNLELILGQEASP
ncbi:MAG: type II toxin-antitoxin system RelE/ParE family toxin [Leptolyngbyaceae cyanobacterium SM1_1_3]|nr:type II toxin-antitoxin system RelE/ParE family toxin [Leptolyngbyaceae cyanobacterium SM1_1_3]NJM85281.1 type II toxin-antitoxin system RelE/ParE family toxin [Leptolyngbyaceae cyanobacterium RM2_2_21]NJN04039.1 type II toxin-antitoxin system RelE/ParE family toxin [Leptolyngbyaceae cyanobacterium RM1_1_2]NJO09746.1 type II toxin-antitoxin system RelE/ParE family toxin [Leptolyngbyaceae cyanobacterium SL_1_1]